MDPLTTLMTRPCAADHFGAWMIEPRWFEQGCHAVEAGLWKPGDPQAMQASGDESGVTVVTHGTYGNGEPRPLYAYDERGRAVIHLHGMMTKGDSSFGGTSTVRARLALRHARDNDAVRGVMLSIDSPGGSAAGTPQLADEVWALTRQAQHRTALGKPVHAWADDLIASAGYFVGCQAQRLTQSVYGEAGSIGTVIVVDDTSKMFEEMGIKRHVVSTGPFKGAFADGTEVTDDQLGYLRETADRLTGPFVAAIARGRRMTAAQARDLAYGDEGGKVWGAERAMQLGMLDGTGSFEQAMDALLGAIRQRETDRQAQTQNRDRRRRIAELG